MKSLKVNIASMLLGAALFGFSCEDSEEEVRILVKAASNITARDVANAGDASDIEVSFNKAEVESQISEYRVILISTEYGEILDVATASSLSGDKVQSISPTGSDLSFRLLPNIKTVEGQELVDGQFYTIYILSVSNGVETNANRLSTPSTAFRISDRSDPAREIFLMDVGNEQNAFDFQVSFIKARDEDKVSSYRVLLSKSEKAENFTTDNIESLISRQYVEIPVTGKDYVANFPADFLDTDREPIQANQFYKSIVISVADGVNALNEELSLVSNELSLENISYVKTLSEEFQGTGGLTYHPNGYLVSGNTSGFFRSRFGNGTYRIELDGSVTHQTIALNSCTGNVYHNIEGVIYQATEGGIYRIFNNGSDMLVVPNGVGRLGTLNSATDVTVINGEVYASNCELPKIYRLQSTFLGIQAVEAKFDNRNGIITCPRYIEADNNGDLIVMNFNDYRLYKITQFAVDVEPTLFAQLPIGENFVSIVYVPSRNTTYATTTENRIIRIHDLRKDIEHVAGQEIASIVDGSLETCSFIRPVNIAASSDGKFLFVLDEVNDKEGIVVMRKIELVD